MWRGGRLEGLAPVFAWRGALMLAGTGPSDHGDWLLAPSAEDAAGDLLATLARARCGTFERIELRQLSPGSAICDAPAPPGWTDEAGEDEPCLGAPLTGDDGLGAATTKCRQNWRYAMRRIAREGGAVEAVPAEEAEAGIAELIRLHGLRWQAKGQGGVIDDLLGAFLRAAAPELSRAGVLRLYRVRFGMRTVAVLLVLAGHGVHYYYLGGFDPDYAALSPSAALVGHAMGQAAREGAAAFDFLRGAEPYKARWGAIPQPTRRRVLVRSG